MALLGNQMWGSEITVEGVTIREGDREPLRKAVGPDFFRTMGTPILLGREFDWRDDEKSGKVAIVNESFAKYYFGSQNPLGKKIGVGGRNGVADSEIVGVVKDTRYASVRGLDSVRQSKAPPSCRPVRLAASALRSTGIDGALGGNETFELGSTNGSLP